MTMIGPKNGSAIMSESWLEKYNMIPIGIAVSNRKETASRRTASQCRRKKRTTCSFGRWSGRWLMLIIKEENRILKRACCLQTYQFEKVLRYMSNHNSTRWEMNHREGGLFRPQTQRQWDRAVIQQHRISTSEINWTNCRWCKTIKKFRMLQRRWKLECWNLWRK